MSRGMSVNSAVLIAWQMARIIWAFATDDWSDLPDIILIAAMCMYVIGTNAENRELTARVPR